MIDDGTPLPPGTRVRFKEWSGFGKWLKIENGLQGTIVPDPSQIGIVVRWDDGREYHHWIECLELLGDQ